MTVADSIRIPTDLLVQLWHRSRHDSPLIKGGLVASELVLAFVCQAELGRTTLLLIDDV